MRKLFLSALLFAAAVSPSVADWRADVDRAIRDARRSESPVMLMVGADWCEACRELESGVLTHPDVREALRPFVRVKADGDRDTELARTYRVEGYPTLIALDRRGREVGRHRGAATTDQLLAFLDESPSRCKLQGVVTDHRGAPAANAKVLLLPDGAEEQTRADGFYCFSEIEPGPRQLVILSADGTDSARGAAIVTPGREHTTFDASLDSGRTEAVVVTATRTAKLKRDVPVRTEVVNRDRIEQSAARTLAEAVEFTPGVRVESNCQNCNFSQVRLLGLEGAYSQILIDGIAQWSPLSMVYGIEQIPARLIDRLEIVKGGGSSTYGPGAVGGVINVVPRRPNRSGGMLDLRGESFDSDDGRSFNGAYDWVSKDRGSFFTVYAQDDRFPGLDLSGDGFTEISKRELTVLGARGEHALLDGNARLTVDLGYFDAFRRGGDQIGLPPEQAELAEEIDTKRTSSTLRFAHDLSERLSYRLAATYITTKRDTYYGGGQDPNAFGFSDNPLLLVEGQFDHRIGKHTISWGSQYQSDGIDDVQPGIGRRLDLTYDNLGLFLQDDWALNPKLTLLYGFRADKHSEIDDPIFSPRAALRFAPTDELNLRTSVSTGFRPPAVFDEDLHIELAGGSQRQVVLADDLDEERSISVMQGFEWIPRRGEAFWLLEANAFFTGISDIFEEEQIASNLFEKRNLGRAEVTGIELGLGYDLPRLFTVELGWVSQRARFDRPEADFGSRNFARTPEQSGVLNATFRSRSLGDTFFSLRYIGSMEVPRFVYDDSGNQTDAYLLESESFLTVDASWARRFTLRDGKTRLRLQIGARNLTDEFQREIDQGPFRDSDFVYGPRFPRSVYASTSLAF